MKQYIEKAITFAEYAGVIEALLADSKTTGPKQSDAMFGYAKLNKQRMDRLAKTVQLGEDVRLAARSLDRKLVWLILTEGWCGDAAQNLPVIEKIAAESGNIETRYLLRDENLDLMEQFLTGGARSIPKLIAIDAANLEVLGTWGARPKPAQELFRGLKNRGVERPFIMENLQRWYNADKGRTIQAELEILLKEWSRTAVARANA